MKLYIIKISLLIILFSLSSCGISNENKDCKKEGYEWYSIIFQECTNKTEIDYCKKAGWEVFNDWTDTNCLINKKFIKLGYYDDLESIKREEKLMNQ